MLQTDRKTETARQSAQDRESARNRSGRETDRSASLTLEAILAGGSPEQLSAEGVLALSHTLGNSALESLLTLRGAAAETETRALPAGACDTAPLVWDGGGDPFITEAPNFGAFAPLGETAPFEG